MRDHPVMTRQVTATALAVLAAATACTSTGPASRTAPPTDKPSTITSSPAPTATATSSPPSMPSATAARGPILGDERKIELGVKADTVVPAGDVVYAFATVSGKVTVVRVDVANRVATARRTFAAQSVRASVGGGRLALLLTSASNRTRQPTATAVELLDLRTLATTATRDLGPAADLVARPEATYVSTPGRILALDPRTLQTRREIAVDDFPKQGASGAEIAADPRSHILYAGIPNSEGPHEPPVDIVDLRTGAVLARPTVPAVVVAEPQGYGDDGWISYATGMMASAQLLSPAGKILAEIGPIGPNSSSIVVAGRHLWTFTQVADFHISCRDLRTGGVQGTAPASDASPVSADSTHVYAFEGSKLLVFTPGGACA
jgi:hypothetical protein